MAKSADVESEAMELLLTELGPTKAAMFLRDHTSRETDYLKFKENTFGQESVASLAQKIQGHY